MTNITQEIFKSQNLIKNIDNELNSLPQGHLIRKGTRYYQRIDDTEIGITNKKRLIKQLCRKKYLLTQKKQLIHNNLILEKSAKKLVHTNLDNTIKKLSKTYQNSPKSNFFHSSIEPWINKPFTQNSFKPEERKYESKAGIRVRSKSELIIANILDEYEIPYRYEPEMIFKGKKICPDFLIKTPFTAKTIIWEHFGALHKPDYEQSMNQKMDFYLDYGLTPFDTVIYTFEFDLKPKRLKSLIEDIILKQ